MFKCLNRVVYRVSDIQQATHWYRKILDKDPSFVSPFVVIFSIADFGLVLTPNANMTSKNADGVVAYWGVDDVVAAYNLLLQSGATTHSEITTTVSGTRRASVRDPFGNILGITGTQVDKNKSSIENHPSETAMFTTFLRALAAMDEREGIRGSDYLAEVFLPEDRKHMLKNVTERVWLINNPPLIFSYSYIIARTVFFDQIVEQALRDNIPQIVFLGAGYDSRPYRFKDLIKETRLFEVDARSTQQSKMELLHKANISIPEQLTFVSVNLNTDDLKECLFKTGYDNNKKTLFIWEGVTCYLLPQAVDDTLSFIKANSPVGSTICFDYNLILSEESDGYSSKENIEVLRSNFPGEPYLFGIERERIDEFLSERGFRKIEQLTAMDMEQKYLALSDGSTAGRITASCCLVHAVVSG